MHKEKTTPGNCAPGMKRVDCIRRPSSLLPPSHHSSTFQHANTPQPHLAPLPPPPPPSPPPPPISLSAPLHPHQPRPQPRDPPAPVCYARSYVWTAAPGKAGTEHSPWRLLHAENNGGIDGRRVRGLGGAWERGGWAIFLFWMGVSLGCG